MSHGKRLRPAGAYRVEAMTSSGAASRRRHRALEMLRPRWLPNHYPSLHGLRTVAVVMVVLVHTTVYISAADLISFTTKQLWFAMDCFFFLSGFLIASLLFVESKSGKPVAAGRFYVRRALRIVPPYLVVLTTLALITPLTESQQKNLWLEYAYLTNYAPPLPDRVVMGWAWSLAVEEHFYLAVPPFVMALRAIPSRSGKLILIAALWATALPLRLWVYLSHGPWNVVDAHMVFYVQTHLRYDILLAGIFAACVQRYYASEISRWLRSSLARWALCLSSATGFALLLATDEISERVFAYKLLHFGTFTTAAYLPLGLFLLNSDSVLSRALSHPAFHRVATFSYGTYLVHIPLIIHVVVPLAEATDTTLAVPRLLSWAFAVLAALCIATFVAYLMHILIEKPALALRDSLFP